MLRTAAIRTRAAQWVSRRNASTVSVQNLEARWKTLSTAEQNTIAKQLEEAQKGDWKFFLLKIRRLPITLLLVLMVLVNLSPSLATVPRLLLVLLVSLPLLVLSSILFVLTVKKHPRPSTKNGKKPPTNISRVKTLTLLVVSLQKVIRELDTLSANKFDTL
ncbi:unnamed protein product [Rhizopus stolonifer]